MNPAQLLIEVVDREPTKHILVVGEAMTDVYVHGQVGGCQEGCVKMLEGEVVRAPGGAMNAANALSQWLVRVSCPSVSYRPKKKRYMVGDRCVFRHDREAAPGVYDYHRGNYERMVRELLPVTNGVLISDYDKGLLSPGFIREIIGRCAERLVPCVADAKRPPETYVGAVVKGNADYFGASQPYAEQARRMDAQAVTTYGKYPALVWDRGEITVVGGELGPVACVNHVGAGDCFAAHMVLALACGFPLKVAAAVAFSAGRVYVQRPHNAPPAPAEVAADMGGAAGV